MSTNLRVSVAPPPVNRNYAGIAAVVVLHLLLAYAIANGLGKKVVEVLRQPLDVALIEESRPTPPPQKPPPPRPRTDVPPPAYVPPVETHVDAPAPAITVTPEAPPPAPEPVAAPAPEPVNVAVACPNHMEVRSHVPYPPRAQAMGLSGEVLVEFVVGTGGEIRNAAIVRSTNSLFDRTAVDAVRKLKCIGQGREARVRVPFMFRLE